MQEPVAQEPVAQEPVAPGPALVKKMTGKKLKLTKSIAV
jgi:hypothetical protein